MKIRYRKISSRVVAEISSSALIQNYLAIRKLALSQSVLPMIKANAYGHGAAWAAKTLLGQPNLYGFGVATLEEGEEIRRELGLKGRKTKILIFSGTLPWSEEKLQFCEQYQLTPVIGSESDWQKFLKDKGPSKIPYELKFNTGMNRLGIDFNGLSRIRKQLKDLPVDQQPSGICSHLMSSEDPAGNHSVNQMKRFKEIVSQLKPVLPSAQFHVANSGAIWNLKKLGLEDLTDIVRVGISLYGVAPWPGAPLRGIVPVLTLKAQVGCIQTVRAGESIGYGGRFSVKRSGEPVKAAVLTAGYADGILRALGPEGHAWINGKLSRFLGTVSMDLCAIEAFSQTNPGDWAELLGPSIDIWSQSQAARTVPYELLTSLSQRVQRIYV